MNVLLVLLAMTLFACGVEAPEPRVKPDGTYNPSLSPEGSKPLQTPPKQPAPTNTSVPKQEPPPVIPADCSTATAPKWTPCTGDTFVPDHPKEGWDHWTTSAYMIARPNPHHRGVDAVFSPSSAQLLSAKFAYGPTHIDLVHERIDVYAERTCGTWDYLGEATTSDDGDYGDEDDGGRVYFYVPESKKLGLGDYRIKMVVKGDHYEANLWAHVWPENAQLVLSDIDGTITTKEWDGLTSWFDSNHPDPRDGASDTFAAYHAKGYYVVFLTARPDTLTEGTREWFADNGFPEGVFHLSLSNTGETGSAARNYKRTFISSLLGKGFKLHALYGNKDTDLAAYLDAGNAPSAITLISGEYTGDLKGARMVDGWLQEAVNVGCSAPI